MRVSSLVGKRRSTVYISLTLVMDLWKSNNPRALARILMHELGHRENKSERDSVRMEEAIEAPVPPLESYLPEIAAVCPGYEGSRDE